MPAKFEDCMKQVIGLVLSLFVFGVSPGVLHAEDPKELFFIFQKQKDPAQVKAAADEVATYLSKEIGIPVKAQVPLDYSASIQAMVSKTADFAYVSSLPFLLAKRDGGATLLLAEQRVDVKGVPRTEYDSVFVVKKDSPLKSLDDVVKGAKDLRFVFTSSTSTSGYLFAYRRLVQEGLLKPKQDPNSVFKSTSFGGGYTQALEQVLQGRADVAAVSYYTVEGPSATTYLPQAEIDKLRILARTPGVPTHVVAARSGLSEELKAKVKAALLKLGNENPKVLTDVYGTATFVETQEAKHFANTIEAVEFLGLPMDNLK